MTTFISYAQNFEDIILNRALKDIVSGFYIDVGANDPIIASVTKAFYNKGWRGLNIEPLSACYEKLLNDRPRDINVCVAAGNYPGEMILYEIMNYTGLSTQDHATALTHSKTLNAPINNHTVPIKTIDAICAEHNIDTVHFMKIDVEKAEKNVLEGMELKRVRPWIILVEATLPGVPVPCYEEWEHLLVNRGYQFVYFDGLNRFYLADEQMHRAAYFNVPPNVFDDFVSFNLVDYVNKVHVLNNQIENHINHIQALQQHIQELQKNRTLKKIKFIIKAFAKKTVLGFCKIINKIPFFKKKLLAFFTLVHQLERHIR